MGYQSGSGMTVLGKEGIKRVLGQIPFTAELYWLVRQKGNPIHSRFSLKHLQETLPRLKEEALELRQSAKPGKKIFIFATLHYWIEHASLLGIALASQGHEVSLGYLPYAEWQTPINLFDLRRQNMYARKVLEGAAPLLEVVPFMTQKAPYKRLPPEVIEEINRVTVYDSQYTLQVEDVDPTSHIYKLRLERNMEAARVALAYLEENRPDIVIVPNGTIQELGVVYRMAKYLKIPVVTYEFGDQRQRIWIAQNAEVMRQETDNLWAARKGTPLNDAQYDRLRSLFEARQHGALWENFARRWQNQPNQGGEQARAALGLNNRPVVLLATNVLGDSLTLGRQVFSHSMAEWIERTVQYFAGKPEAQLVIRIHPGEVLTHGLSMLNVVKRVLPKLPEHIHLIGPQDKMNTYDLMEVADLGLIYTTTVGLEMAMNGFPVIVAGQTHFRNRGFTYDADSWVNYFKMLGQALENPAKLALSQEQVELAWQYAYRFFFDFPHAFPWHLVRVWEDYRVRSLKTVFSAEGSKQYQQTFNYLVGEPINWNIEGEQAAG